MPTSRASSVLAEEPADPLAQALALEERVAGEVAGLYRLAVENDRARTRRYQGEPAWDGATEDGDEGFIRTVVAAAANEDAAIFRAHKRRESLLDPPGALAQNTAVLERARAFAAVRQPAPESPERRGPTRDELLQIMAAARLNDMDQPATV